MIKLGLLSLLVFLECGAFAWPNCKVDCPDRPAPAWANVNSLSVASVPAVHHCAALATQDFEAIDLFITIPASGEIANLVLKVGAKTYQTDIKFSSWHESTSGKSRCPVESDGLSFITNDPATDFQSLSITTHETFGSCGIGVSNQLNLRIDHEIKSVVLSCDTVFSHFDWQPSCLLGQQICGNSCISARATCNE